MARPGWDDYFLDIARTTARRSTCPRAQVGALIVVNNQIISHGYNGAPAGLPHCDEVGCNIHDNHCVRTVHAEVNAILKAGDRLHKGFHQNVLYTTHLPCYECCKIILNTDVDRLVFDKTYFDDRSYFAEGSSQYDFLWSSGKIEIVGQVIYTGE